MTEAIDVILVGGGVMSVILGALLKGLEPSWETILIERLDEITQESSNPWNNTGTGHPASCELNYAPLGTDGKVYPECALSITEQFQLSRQSWASLVSKDKLADNSFINTVPHMSLAMCQDHCDYLQKRFDVLRS